MWRYERVSTIGGRWGAREVDARGVGDHLLLADAALDGEERPLGVCGVLVEEPREELEVPRAEVLCVELGW